MAATGAPVRVPVAVACEVLGLSRQGDYQWLAEPVSQRDGDDALAINALRDIHQDDPTLGYRFLTDELDDVGISASQNRVWRLCSMAGVFASHHRRRAKAHKPGPPVHDDLLAFVDEHGVTRHDFTASAPDEKWLTDITEHLTSEGKVYLCAVKDCYSGRIMGYSIDSRMKSALATSAIRNAITQRDPVGTICHSDRGSQGGFNWSSQHLDRGGVQQWRRSTGLRRQARFLKGLDVSGARIERCGRRCARLGGPSPRGRCSGSSGV